LFHPNEIEKPGFDPSDAIEFWDLVNRQDWAICEGVQRGMQSRVFESGFYAPMESFSLDLRRYVGERLSGEGK
ncbi:MAG TPA: SRPBCC family protein, partial [Gemmatimonadaceae bacterium]|nr:SRPBCC family protein [Gemmatimonadaceae bacterium]